MLMSAIIKTCSKGNNKKQVQAGDSFWRCVGNGAGSQERGQDVRSLSTSPPSAPVFARLRLRGANGPNSHWLCVSISAV